MTKTERYRRVSKFELHDLIGEGAMGVVWKAYDTVIRRYVALKLLSSRIGKTSDARQRFLREGRAAGVLQHPNLVTLYDLGEDEGQLYIAMELVEGRDVSAVIANNEPLALERKLDIVIELLEGLAYAHERGVIHRDIKPSPNYMAPEQVTNGPITPATDLFSVGCLLYELLSYRKPFEGETLHGVLYQVLTTDPKALRTTAPSIPAGLERVVAKALNKVPEDRYQAARQMQQALLGIRAALSGASDTTERLGPRWTPVPLPLLRLITHTSLKWRVVVLSALATVALVLFFASRGPVQPALLPPPTADAPTPLDQLLAVPLPPTLNPALAALRDSAVAARERARRAGALKNNVRSVVLAEIMLQTAEQASHSGDQARASSAYVAAVAEYKKAQAEADQLRLEAEQALGRATPVVKGLATRPEAARAASSLARAESLFTAMDYALAKLAARDAEQVGVAAGVAPPSPQPAQAQAAIEVLLLDLARAVGSKRVANLRLLFPSMTAREAAKWARFFQSAAQLEATYAAATVQVRGTAATATVQAAYRFVPTGGGAQREERAQLAMTFTKTPLGWRIASAQALTK